MVHSPPPQGPRRQSETKQIRGRLWFSIPNWSIDYSGITLADLLGGHFRGDHLEIAFGERAEALSNSSLIELTLLEVRPGTENAEARS